jgi:hypothetical protein
MSGVNVWDFYQSLPVAGRSRNRLSDIERSVAAICDLRQEVGAGGFDGYFRAWGAYSAPEALDALGIVLGPEWAAVLDEAMQVNSLRGLPDASSDESALDEELHALESRFFELERSTDADKLLSDYLATRLDR